MHVICFFREPMVKFVVTFGGKLANYNGNDPGNREKQFHEARSLNCFQTLPRAKGKTSSTIIHIIC